MRRSLLLIAGAAAALTFVSTSPAAGGSSYGPARLTIVTVPRLAGIHFALDGRTFVTGRHGNVRIRTTQGQHLLRILNTRVDGPGVRSTFERWEDNQYAATRPITIRGNTVLDAGFQQSVRVSFAFADLAGRPVFGRVSKLTLSNTLGSRLSFAPSWPQWLRATGLARSFRGLEPTYIQYSIQRALVDRSNVINQSQQRFYPAKTRRFTTRLLLYSARVSVRDFLFGTSTGNQVALVYPGGTQVDYPLRRGSVLLSSLPRGTYRVQVHAGGYVPSVSLALSKNQVLDVKVVSYLDMILLFVLVLVSVSVLIIVPRPFLRLRLRSLGSGRQPTPDDLEPLTPLSRVRKALIDRYMPQQQNPPAGSSASREVPRSPSPAPRPTATPTNEEKVGRPLRHLPSHSLETAVESLRRRREQLAEVPALSQRLRPTATSQIPEEALKGERIDLIKVYMQEHMAPSADTEATEATASQAPQPATASTPGAAAHAESPPTSAEPADTLPAPPTRLAPVIELRTTPAVEEKPALASAAEEDAPPMVEESPTPAGEDKSARPIEEDSSEAVEEDAAPAAEEAPAAPRKSSAPERRRRTTVAAEEQSAQSVEADTPAPTEGAASTPRKKAAPAKRKRATPAADGKAAPAPRKRSTTAGPKAAAPKATTSAQPARKRAAAKKKSTTAATKRTTPTKQKTKAQAKPKPTKTKTKKATTPAAAQRRTRRTSGPAAAAEETARNGKAGAATNGEAVSDVLSRLRALDTAIGALQDELKKARTITAKNSRRKTTDGVSR